jgi:hypothetical protein
VWLGYPLQRHAGNKAFSSPLLRSSSLLYSSYFHLLQAVVNEHGLYLGFGGKTASAAAIEILELGPIVCGRLLALAGMAMQDADGFHMDGEWFCLEDIRVWLLQRIADELPLRGVVEALELFWEHPDDPGCLKGVLLQSLEGFCPKRK